MEHYYSEKQESAYKPFKINIELKNDSFDLYSAQGIFSKKDIDKASKLLIEKGKVLDGSKVLDLGCGYGIIGIGLARRHNNLNMSFSDVNERALKLTHKNLELLGLKGKIIKSYLFKNITGRFDCIVTNPPFAAGRKLCYLFIEGAFKHLNGGGTLQLVGRHNKGGKALKDKMLEVFGNVEDLAKSSGFRVYISKKK